MKTNIYEENEDSKGVIRSRKS